MKPHFDKPPEDRIHFWRDIYPLLTPEECKFEKQYRDRANKWLDSSSMEDHPSLRAFISDRSMFTTFDGVSWDSIYRRLRVGFV